MVYCKSCGAQLPDGFRYCPICGADAEGMRLAPPEYEAPKKKPIYKKWWFWCLLIFALMLISSTLSHKKPAPVQETTISEPAQRVAATPKPAPTSTPQPVAAENEIRPEVKEFLDSYEAFTEEYIAFMERFENADATDLAAMMGDYASILARYADFAEKVDAMEDDDLTDAELAYYLEVTTRVSQKLLLAAG